MRNAVLVLLPLLLCIPFSGVAQNTDNDRASISGTVLNAEDAPLPSASVAIYDSSKTEIITGVATQATGYFEIELEPGSYVVEITFISFKPYQQKIELSAGEEVSLGTITMVPTAQSLESLVVRGQQSRMELSFDKRIFNVGSDIVSLGGSALNVLNNVPSIVTDIDGNISLRGNESVRVLINGQPSNLVSDGVEALRSIPASMILKVEIITNPSAQYSAEGTAGIINIILKKEKEIGFNGNVSAGAGHPANYDAGTNLNYRINNVNLFFGGSLDYRSSPEEGSSFQRFGSPDTSYMYRELQEEEESSYDGDIRFGADFLLSENETLTARTSIELENGDNENSVFYTDFLYEEGAVYSDPTFNGDIIQRITREELVDSKQKQYEFNLQYENRYDRQDHKLTAEIDFDIERESQATDIEVLSKVSSAQPLLQRVNDSEEGMDLRADIDYVRPLGENLKLEAGARTSFNRMENDYRFTEQHNGNWVEIPAFNNNFTFNENVNSAYLIFGAEFGSFSGQIGLRLENTRLSTELQGTGAENKQNYTDLFPSIFLNYSLNEYHSFQVSYSRRLDRPWSRMLLPFTDYAESRSRFTGNPNLDPEFSNSFEAGYLFYWETGSVLTSLYYRHRTGVIERITLLDDDGFTRRLPINLATEDAYGVEFSADQDLFNGLTLTANANFYSSESEGEYQNQLFDSQTETFQTRIGIRWNIGDVWNFQASGRYRAPRETTQGEREGMKMMDMGMSRELFDGKAIISLSIRDLLNTRNFEYTITDDGNPLTDFYAHRASQWSSRSFSISFQYFFGNNERRGGNRDGDRGSGGGERYD